MSLCWTSCDRDENFEVFASYLNERRQIHRDGLFVECDDDNYNGHPKGSLLGPLLFNLNENRQTFCRSGC
jgi:hypothetical protein